MVYIVTSSTLISFNKFLMQPGRRHMLGWRGMLIWPVGLMLWPLIQTGMLWWYFLVVLYRTRRFCRLNDDETSRIIAKNFIPPKKPAENTQPALPTLNFPCNSRPSLPFGKAVWNHLAKALKVVRWSMPEAWKMCEKIMVNAWLLETRQQLSRYDKIICF